MTQNARRGRSRGTRADSRLGQNPLLHSNGRPRSCPPNNRNPSGMFPRLRITARSRLRPRRFRGTRREPSPMRITGLHSLGIGPEMTSRFRVVRNRRPPSGRRRSYSPTAFPILHQADIWRTISGTRHPKSQRSRYCLILLNLLEESECPPCRVRGRGVQAGKRHQSYSMVFVPSVCKGAIRVS